MDAINRELAERTDYESEAYAQLIEQSTTLQEQLQMSGGQSWRADMERTLMGLGFERTDFQRPTSEFSGGWRARQNPAAAARRAAAGRADQPPRH